MPALKPGAGALVDQPPPTTSLPKAAGRPGCSRPGGRRGRPGPGRRRRGVGGRGGRHGRQPGRPGRRARRFRDRLPGALLSLDSRVARPSLGPRSRRGAPGDGRQPCPAVPTGRAIARGLGREAHRHSSFCGRVIDGRAPVGRHRRRRRPRLAHRSGHVRQGHRRLGLGRVRCGGRDRYGRVHLASPERADQRRRPGTHTRTAPHRHHRGRLDGRVVAGGRARVAMRALRGDPTLGSRGSSGDGSRRERAGRSDHARRHRNLRGGVRRGLLGLGLRRRTRARRRRRHARAEDHLHPRGRRDRAVPTRTRTGRSAPPRAARSGAPRSARTLQTNGANHHVPARAQRGSAGRVGDRTGAR